MVADSRGQRIVCKNGKQMTYHEFKMKAELRGISPVPERVFRKYREISLENELLEGISLDERRKPVSPDSVFSLVASYVIGTGGRVKDGWLEAVGVRDVSLTGIDRIGYNAFYGCKTLWSVSIPSSVTSLGSFAFANCSGLTIVTIPDSVTSIESYVFDGCNGLTSVTIPDRVTDIWWSAFAWCTNLTSVTIPNSVTSIGEGAFGWCRGLESVTIGNGVTSIGSYAFQGCTRLRDVVFQGKTKDEVMSMENYPWSLKDLSVLKYEP